MRRGESVPPGLAPSIVDCGPSERFRAGRANLVVRKSDRAMVRPLPELCLLALRTLARSALSRANVTNLPPRYCAPHVRTFSRRFYLTKDSQQLVSKLPRERQMADGCLFWPANLPNPFYAIVVCFRARATFFECRNADATDKLKGNRGCVLGRGFRSRRCFFAEDSVSPIG